MCNRLHRVQQAVIDGTSTISTRKLNCIPTLTKGYKLKIDRSSKGKKLGPSGMGVTIKNQFSEMFMPFSGSMGIGRSEDQNAYQLKRISYWFPPIVKSRRQWKMTYKMQFLGRVVRKKTLIDCSLCKMRSKHYALPECFI